MVPFLIKYLMQIKSIHLKKSFNFVRPYNFKHLYLCIRVIKERFTNYQV